MDGGPPRADQTVLVNGTTIQTVGDRTSIPVPDGAEVVEAQGLFLIPGLTDAHAHPRTEQDLLPYLANGVTTIVSLGHPEFAPVLEWRDRIAAGSLLGPTIYATGRILDGTNLRGTATLVADPEAGRRAVRAQAAAGVDFIKVYNGLSVATFNAIMDQARTEGLAVVGHGVRAPGFEGILDAGVAAIAHAEEIYYTHFRSTVDPSLVSSAVERIASAGAWVMPNLSTFERVVLQWGNTAALHQWVASPENRFLHPNHTQNWFTFHQNAYANRTGSLRPVLGLLTTLTGALHEAGVPLLLASDSPIIPGLYPGFSIHEDLRLLTAAGLTAQEALEVGTVNGGRFIAEHHRSDDVFGTISAGQRADLVLVAGDPTVDLGVLRSPRGVMVRGRFLSGPRLEQLLEDLARGMGND